MKYSILVIILLLGLNLYSFIHFHDDNDKLNQYRSLLKEASKRVDEHNNNLYNEYSIAILRDPVRTINKRKMLDKIHNQIVNTKENLDEVDLIKLRLDYSDSLSKYINSISGCNIIEEKYQYFEYEYMNRYYNINDTAYFSFDLSNICNRVGMVEIIGCSVSKEATIGNNNIQFEIPLIQHVPELTNLKDYGISRLVYRYSVYLKDHMNGNIDTLDRVKFITLELTK